MVTATSSHWQKTTATNFLSELIAERGNWDRRILISPMNFYVNGKQYSFISSPKYLEYRKLHLEPAPCTLALHSMCNSSLGSTRICNSSLVTSNLKYAPSCYKHSHPLHRWSNYFVVRRWVSESGRDWKRLLGALEKRILPLFPLAVHWWEAGLQRWLFQVDNLPRSFSSSIPQWLPTPRSDNQHYSKVNGSLAHWKENFPGYNTRFGVYCSCNLTLKRTTWKSAKGIRSDAVWNWTIRLRSDWFLLWASAVLLQEKSSCLLNNSSLVRAL